MYRRISQPLYLRNFSGKFGIKADQTGSIGEFFRPTVQQIGSQRRMFFPNLFHHLRPSFLQPLQFAGRGFLYFRRLWRWRGWSRRWRWRCRRRSFRFRFRFGLSYFFFWLSSDPERASTSFHTSSRVAKRAIREALIKLVSNNVRLESE